MVYLGKYLPDLTACLSQRALVALMDGCIMAAEWEMSSVFSPWWAAQGLIGPSTCKAFSFTKGQHWYGFALFLVSKGNQANRG